MQDKDKQPLQILLIFIIMWQFAFGVSNNAISVLVGFFHNFFKFLAKGGTHVYNLWEICPKSLKGCQKFINLKCPQFERFVVCPSCDAIYHISNCPATCIHKQYPNHPQTQFRKPCGAPLLIKRKGSIRAIKTYCYQPLQSAMGMIINRPNFLEKCELWRTRYSTPNLLSDIYDGNIWNEFHTINEIPFLAIPNNLGIGLGCDWFQPYKHVNYSVGALYIFFYNLPREERMKLENVVLLGLIPGPSEPKKLMNSYLGPFVHDMQKFWEGVPLWHESRKQLISVRMALLSVMCDIPATRKLCGFAGHSAAHGCSKCLKKFGWSSADNKLDFSGYDRDLWEARTNENYILSSELYLHAPTKTAKQHVVSEHGVRYSLLVQLPYFDIIRMHAIDPMHNLLLGTAKHMLSVWIEEKLISKSTLRKIAGIATKICVPRSSGRLPLKIESNFAGFTADQWKNWITIYSSVCLKDHLPSDHLQCWLLYVRACSILLSTAVTKEHIATADAYLLQFCKVFQRLYGGKYCTINMHLHLHLHNCIFDYGPVYSFWCFSFERFNGILGSYYTNKHNIETQFIKKFLQHQASMSLQLPQEFGYLLAADKVESNSGSILYGSFSPEYFQLHLKLALSPMSDLVRLDFSVNEPSLATLLPPVHRSYMSANLASELNSIYKYLYASHDEISAEYFTSVKACLAGQILHSSKAITERGSMICAYWPTKGSEEIDALIHSCLPGDVQFGIIQFFIEHTVTLDKKFKRKHIFAFIKWLQHHTHEFWYGQSATICKLTFEESSVCNYLPLQRIYSVCAHAQLELNFGDETEAVFVAIPSHVSSLIR